MLISKFSDASRIFDTDIYCVRKSWIVLTEVAQVEACMKWDGCLSSPHNASCVCSVYRVGVTSSMLQFVTGVHGLECLDLRVKIFPCSACNDHSEGPVEY